MNDKTRKIILALVIIAVAVSIYFLEYRKVTFDENAEEVEVTPVTKNEDKSKKYEIAKEITTPDAFINTDEIKIADLIGKKVILVDFWTYSCINCQRTLPYLNDWHKKYSDKGLVILGIHTPEFEFEKDLENVKKAVEKFEIKYPVILDNDYSTWQAYKNRYWPRKYLIDLDGYIVYDHIGEGAYKETEEKIVELLNVKMSETEVTGVQNVDFSKVNTPETYLGYARSERFQNLPKADCYDVFCDYILPKNLEGNSFALNGKWKLGEENIELENGIGEIQLNFSASKVNLVAGSSDGATAEIYLDGKLLNEVKFNDYNLYTIVDLAGKYEAHTVTVKILKGQLQAFAFTFG